jgi:hypothetical protein
MANLIRLIKGLSTSFKEKNHEIAKLMNKIKNMNEGGQTLAVRVVQEDQMDVVEDSTIRATRNIHGITDGVLTVNQ